MHGRKRLLIVSHGPIPTPEHLHVEGGGLRCWGLARGIRSNAPDVEITVAYHDSYRKPGHTPEFEGIRIATWDHETIDALARGFDSVLMSYCMGEPAVRLVRGMRRDQQLVLDCYVPIFTEVSARDSADVIREQANYLREIDSWREPLLRRGLLPLRHLAQERYYRGVLSAMGRINPMTYGRSMILEVPYGIYRDNPVVTDHPIMRLVGDGPARKILWFGGMYPWFDARGLVDAVAQVNRTLPARLIIVGAEPVQFPSRPPGDVPGARRVRRPPRVSRPRDHAGLGRFPAAGRLVPRRRPRGDGE